MLSRYAALMAAVLLAPGMAAGQAFSDGFPFFMPPGDSAGTQFLPAFPAHPITEEDRVAVAGDEFVRGDEPIRFFGGNLVADGAFPTSGVANAAAGRLRKMGFNLIRFHHLDNPWSSRAIFPRNGTTRELDAEMLGRLEYLIYRLKHEGIYVNMNLHVSRTFTAADGVANAGELPEFGKGVTYFDPYLIELQKEYARQLLRHENPYTGTALADDPVLAMVEITNENSLYLMWRNGELRSRADGGSLPARHDDMLDDLWRDFLAERYATTDLLAAAWSADAVETGREIIDAPSFEGAIAYPWVLEQHGGGVASYTRDTGNPYAGTGAARVSVSQEGPNDWNVQWKQVGISLKKDSSYTVTFAMRAEQARSIPVSVMKDVDPWTAWKSYTASVTTEWRTFRFSFTAPETAQGDMRLSFIVGGETGSVWLDDVSMRRAGRTGLADDETLENVRRIEASDALSFSDRRLQDMTAFYIHLQDAYFTEMSGFLKDELGVRAPITGTNWNFGLVDLAVQSKLDYIDNHSYWDHPQFPNEPWSSTDWRIDNTPMVLNPAGSTIPRVLAGVPFEGKPFTISEYNHAFPNRYQTEGVLILTAYAGFHGVDGLMFFDYNGGTDWTSDRIDSYFSVHRNPAMMALMPSSAYAFRHGFIHPAETKLTANYAREDVLRFPALDGGSWEGVSAFPRALALEHAVVTGSFDYGGPTDMSSFPTSSGSPYVTTTGEISWDGEGLLKVATPQFEGATGFLEDFAGAAIGRATIDDASGFATMTWVSLTDAPLQTARRSLITLSSAAQNTAMVWDGTQTIHNQWGHAPTLVRPERVNLTLHIDADSLRIYPLDPTGKTGEVVSALPVAQGTFRLVLDQHLMPTVWFGLEAFGSGSETGSRPLPSQVFRLASIYPNPASDRARVVIEAPARGALHLELYDMLGRRVLNERLNVTPGRQSIEVDVSRLAAGVYRIHLSDGAHEAAAALVVR